MDLHFVQRGAGPPILLVQGLGGDVVHWGESFLGRLERRFAVTAYDHRGVGRSPAAAGAFTIADLADDAAGLLDRLGIDATHVLGLSMGGMVAQELALRHRARVRTLTLAGTFAGGAAALRTYPPMVQAIAGPLLRGGRPPAALTAMVAQQARQYGVVRDEGTLATILTQLAAVGAHDTLDRLPGLDVPTLVVHGERDPVIPVENARVLAGAIPGARLEIVPGGGHVVFWERPEWSARLLADFALGAGEASSAA